MILKSAGNFTRDEYTHLNAEKFSESNFLCSRGAKFLPASNFPTPARPSRFENFCDGQLVEVAVYLATPRKLLPILSQRNTDHGAHGETTSQSHAGVYALNGSAFPCVAMLACSAKAHGAKGVNGSGSGKSPPHGAGVWGDSDEGIGVYGASKSSNAGEFDGDVAVTGNITVKGNITAGDVILTAAMVSGGDCAERFDLSEAATAEAGTVMVIGQDGALRPSSCAYDRKVAGVVSGAGSFRPGIVLDKRDRDDEGRATIALVGKVYCKVDADEAPISVGDLLTTSPTCGHAMRAVDPMKAFGAVIGKALAALDEGCGLIPILVALQ